MPESRTCVIANGIDRHKLLAQKDMPLHDSLAIDRSDFVIATVGSLIERKGVDLLITAVAQLIKKNVPVHLLIIGDGPEEDNLQQQIKQLELQHKITLLGEQQNVHGILRGTVDLFVSAAREEAFGLVLAEASLAKLAIVAPATGGISDVVIDGETGLLFPTENVDELVNSIYKLYRNPSLCNSMGKAGYQHILNNFSSDNNAQQFQQLYNKMLKRSPAVKPWYKNWELNLALMNTYKGITKRGSVHEI
jgi:glycosyltransferase involved in cell wall biosynthesis